MKTLSESAAEFVPCPVCGGTGGAIGDGLEFPCHSSFAINELIGFESGYDAETCAVLIKMVQPRAIIEWESGVTFRLKV